MSSHMTLPRKGNIEQVLHIFAFLSKNRNAETVFDPSDPVVDEETMNLKIGHQVRLIMSKVKRNCLPTFQNPVDLAL